MSYQSLSKLFVNVMISIMSICARVKRPRPSAKSGPTSVGRSAIRGLWSEESETEVAPGAQKDRSANELGEFEANVAQDPTSPAGHFRVWGEVSCLDTSCQRRRRENLDDFGIRQTDSGARSPNGSNCLVDRGGQFPRIA